MHHGAGPPSRLSSDELRPVDRVATRYSWLVLDYSRLIDLMTVELCRGRAGNPVGRRQARDEVTRARTALALLREELISAANARSGVPAGLRLYPVDAVAVAEEQEHPSEV